MIVITSTDSPGWSGTITLNGKVANLTGKTVRVAVNPAEDLAIQSLPAIDATVIDPLLGTISFAWPGDTLPVGKYAYEIKIIDGIVERTCPRLEFWVLAGTI